MGKTKRKTSSAGTKAPRDKDTTTSHAPDWPIIALAGGGILITAYLTTLAFLNAPAAFCAEGSGCDIMQQSQWSSFLGLPMALWGFMVYVALAMMAWRMPDRLKRWRRLWSLSLIGLAISLYLTVIGIVMLDAVCPWCLASLAIITSIFIVLTLRRPASAPGMLWRHWLANTGSIAVAAVIALHLWSSELLTHPDTPRLTALAAHLDATGAKYYGAWWCSACQEQKRLFHGAGDNLPFVECSSGGRGSPMRASCQSLGIESYPTWIINGRSYTGTLAPADLARFSRFGWE